LHARTVSKKQKCLDTRTRIQGGSEDDERDDEEKEEDDRGRRA
jgi:hypothetical protein